MGQLAAALQALAKGATAPAPSAPVAGGGALDAESYRNLLSHSLGTENDPINQGTGSKVSGQWALERIKRTRRERPEVVFQAGVDAVTEQLGVLEGEAWSFRRHADTELIPQCGNFATLKRMLAVIAAALDEGRTHGAASQAAFLIHVYRVLEATARDPNHEMQWPWPLLGIPDPAGRARPSWAPGESAAVVAYHREEAALEESKKKLSRRSDDPPTDASHVPGWLKAKIVAEAKGKGKGGRGGQGKAAGAAPGAAGAASSSTAPV